MDESTESTDLNPQTTNEPRLRLTTVTERVLAMSGYALLLASAASFLVMVYLAYKKVSDGYLVAEDWLEFVQYESSTIALLIIAVVTATLGKSLVTTVRVAGARTIPLEDFPLVQQAVIAGKSGPIDQYVRLRSLSGISGTFTKLQITGLPLTTVTLTLIFSFISLMPTAQAANFLDLAKLTLGAFIGSFVQRNVERQKQDPEERAKQDLVA